MCCHGEVSLLHFRNVLSRIWLLANRQSKDKNGNVWISEAAEIMWNKTSYFVDTSLYTLVNTSHGNKTMFIDYSELGNMII